MMRPTVAACHLPWPEGVGNSHAGQLGSNRGERLGYPRRLLSARSRYGTAVDLAPLTYLRLPLLVLVAWAMFAEPLNWTGVLGIVLICSADLFWRRLR